MPSDSIGEQTLIQGNCLTEMKKLEESSIDVVVTSPPYNLNLAYGKYDDSKTEDDYVSWLVDDVSARIKALLKPDGSFFLNLAGSNSRPWVPFRVIVELRKLKFQLQNHIVWIKSIGIGSGSTGHFKPVPGRRFLHHNHEHIFHLTLNAAVELNRLSIGLPFQDKSNIARRGHERDLRCRGNTWFIPYPTVKSKAQKFWHPSTFPVELPLWCIYLHGRRPGSVLDPFVGTGTTLVAAHLAGAQGIGIDIDPVYIETARHRVSKIVESTIKLTLSRDEMEELFKQDESQRDKGGFQAKFVYFQSRIEKTTGDIVITDEDLDWVKRHGSHPDKGGWQRRVWKIFHPHVDLKAAVLAE